MTELYRMLLLVITQKLDELKTELCTQIRTFHQQVPDEEKDQHRLDLGVSGFWNFLLEVVFNFYIILCYAISVTLISVLAIVFYPLNAVLTLMTSLFRQTHISILVPQDAPVLDKISPEFDPDPVIIKKSDVKEKK
jgi:hypothetical protein